MAPEAIGNSVTRRSLNSDSQSSAGLRRASAVAGDPPFLCSEITRTAAPPERKPGEVSAQPRVYAAKRMSPALRQLTDEVLVSGQPLQRCGTGRLCEFTGGTRVPRTPIGERPVFAGVCRFESGRGVGRVDSPSGATLHVTRMPTRKSSTCRENRPCVLSVRVRPGDTFRRLRYPRGRGGSH